MTAVIIFLSILFIPLIVLLAVFASPWGRGKIGEFKVKLFIGKTKEGKRYVFNDFIIVADGRSSQIDHLLINQNGVFVIETKNYSGRIYGREEDKQWTQVLLTKRYKSIKNHFYNPFKQNATHVRRLLEFLPKDTPIQSLVVFVQGNIKYIDAPVCNLWSLRKRIMTPIGAKLLSLKEMEVLSNCVQKAINANSFTNKQHVQAIKQRRKDIENNICPRCGAKLVLRHGQLGDFYGCSHYPKCRFIKKIDK